MKFVTFASFATLAFAVPAMADSINFSQFGSTGTAVASGGAGTTNGGVSFTVSDLNLGGFTEYCEDKNRQCANYDTWAGEFYKNEVILYNNGEPSPVTINFATPLTSLTDLQAQANDYGAFTETLNAYSGATLVDSESAAWFNSVSDPLYGEGTIPKLSVAGADITSVTISTTNDGGGLALGGIGGVNNSGTPEPATWALMVIGVGGIGFLARRRSSKAIVA